jgi:hypothetical protein
MSSTATNVQTEYQFDLATDNTFLGNSKSGSYIYTGVTSDVNKQIGTSIIIQSKNDLHYYSHY